MEWKGRVMGNTESERDGLPSVRGIRAAYDRKPLSYKGKGPSETEGERSSWEKGC